MKEEAERDDRYQGRQKKKTPERLGCAGIAGAGAARRRTCHAGTCPCPRARRRRLLAAIVATSSPRPPRTASAKSQQKRRAAVGTRPTNTRPEKAPSTWSANVGHHGEQHSAQPPNASESHGKLHSAGGTAVERSQGRENTSWLVVHIGPSSSASLHATRESSRSWRALPPTPPLSLSLQLDFKQQTSAMARCLHPDLHATRTRIRSLRTLQGHAVETQRGGGQHQTSSARGAGSSARRTFRSNAERGPSRLAERGSPKRWTTPKGEIFIRTPSQGEAFVGRFESQKSSPAQMSVPAAAHLLFTALSQW
ncbi:uncharacterized protein LOC116951124 isoform X3 [Petromyzon marinus]|uniref:uncharacterized protein LOC116951124 isoform X3 n=1 Tax=Petromyzon marinus TaxID=7757 RepID=UPI003F7063C1